jgi:hypothetical protein
MWRGPRIAILPEPEGPRRVLEMFVADDRGAELVEWVVLTFLIVTASYWVMLRIRTELGLTFARILRRFLGERFVPGAG